VQANTVTQTPSPYKEVTDRRLDPEAQMFITSGDSRLMAEPQGAWKCYCFDRQTEKT